MVCKVKSLDWDSKGGSLVAGTNFIRYEVSEVDDDTGRHFQLIVSHFGSMYSRRDLLEEIKAVAQEDFERRIRSALE